MNHLPEKQSEEDFFILDLSDVVPKDDIASMEHPLFSLATKPDMRHLEYKNGDNKLVIVPSGIGLPTIFDKDILIFCISQLMQKKNKGENIGKRVRFRARELMIATNRKTGGVEYNRLKQAFTRLRGTTFETNITTQNRRETRLFGLIEEGGFVMKEEGEWRLDYCEIVLSDWLMRAIDNDDVVTISNDYFRLRRPLERRIYEIARKHCGKQKRWNINLAKLQEKTGSNAPLKKFRLNVRQIIKDDHTPFYRLELTPDDLVVFRPRQQHVRSVVGIALPTWAEEKSREIAREKGWDYHVLRANWMDFAQEATDKGNPPKNAGAAFVAYCNKQDKLR